MLCTHTEKYHGTAGKAFIQELIEGISKHIERVQQLIEQFKHENSPPAADGQVLRVLNRFALIAAAVDFWRLRRTIRFETGSIAQGIKNLLDSVYSNGNHSNRLLSKLNF